MDSDRRFMRMRRPSASRHHGVDDMNVFDFDGTLYDGDSGTDFYRFCLRRRKSLVRYWPRQVYGWLGKHLLRRDNTWMKQRYYAFFKGIDAVAMAEEFWDENIDQMFPWYRDVQDDSDLVISASPEFLVKAACRRIGVSNVIASEVDPRTGRCLGRNCRDHEKVNRFRREYGDAEIGDFYSDSYADTPLAELAERAFMIKGGEVTEWDFEGAPDYYGERSPHPVHEPGGERRTERQGAFRRLLARGCDIPDPIQVGFVEEDGQVETS